MESPASSPSSPGRASCPGLRAAASSLTDGDVVLKKRRLLQACRRSPAEGGETKEQRGQWWKKVEIGVDFVPDSQGGTDDDLVFVSASDASQIGDGSVAVRGDAEACTKGSSIVQRLRENFPPLPSLVDQYREIMNKYYGGVDRFHMLDGSRDVEDSQETMDEQLLLDDDAQAVEDDSQAVDDDELLVEDDSQAVDDDELLVEDDSQAVDDDELLLVDDDSQPLTRSGSMFKSSKLAPPPSAPCAAPPSADSTGAPSGSCTGELFRSRNPTPGSMQGAPSPRGVQGPPSPSAAAGMASSSQ
ncbi:hypothetical protein EJB05_00412 [Eragrostis curvula]|uniref:Uncharacterized protein n=1 Tax=Eragrostis curvula TaxID=38414 RepID=A0A5J9WP05_9POAL|nr:hypothetical protein EJB05_00412 [Eragrostis curvula]